MAYPRKDQAPESLFDWRYQYDPIRDALEGAAAAIKFNDPSLTIQSFTQDTDINVMMKRMGVTDGAIPPAAADPRYYGDFSDVPDFRQALEATRNAQRTFDALPHELRSRFANDPVRLWDFVNNPENADEAVKLGLLKRYVPEQQPLNVAVQGDTPKT